MIEGISKSYIHGVDSWPFNGI